MVEQALLECKVRSAEIDAKEHRIIRVDVDWLLGVEEKARKAGFESAALVVNAKGAKRPLVLIDYGQYLDLLALKKHLEEVGVQGQEAVE